MVWIVGIALLILLDFVSKQLVMKCLELHVSTSVIGEWLHITYVQNKGAAFGIMQNKQWFFIIVSAVVLFVFILYWIKKKPDSKWLKTSFMFVIAGAIGNLIDRVFYGFVVDFIYVKIIDYPVFNIADIFVVTGVIMLCIHILFMDIPDKEMLKKNDIRHFEEFNRESETAEKE